MLTSHDMSCRLLKTAFASLSIAAMLSACGQSSAPSTGAGVSAAPVTDSASQSEVQTREAQVAQREAEVAKREAEIAAKEQEETRRQAESEAAAQAAADAAAAKKAAARKAATPVKKRTVVASAPPPPTKPVPAKPVEQLVQVPGGTALNVALASDMSSKTARAGDTFVATLASNLTINGQVAVPIGTRISGTITDVISGSRAIGATPTLGLQFNQLELEDGQIIPITGELVQTGQSEKVRDTAKILGGVAAGAVLGHQVKTNNRGKVIGGLLGGAIGAVAARKTGTEVELPAGSTLTLTTGEPFTVKVREAPPP